MSKYQIWECKIVISGDAKLPDGFEVPPKIAARLVIEGAGFNTIACFSRWGASLSREGVKRIEEDSYKEK